MIELAQANLYDPIRFGLNRRIEKKERKKIGKEQANYDGD